MTDASGLRERIVRVATPGVTMGALALYGLSVVALTMSDARVASFAPGVTKPDLRFGYGYAELVDVLEAFGPGGRSAYAWNLAIDSVMPVFFAAATLLVLARVAPRWLGVLGAAPLVFAVVDLIENASFGWMLIQFPEVSASLVAVTRWLTMVKLSAFYVALPTLIVGAVILLVRWLQGRWKARSA